MTFQRSSKKSSGSILTGYRIPTTARMDSAPRNIATTVPAFDMPAGGLTIAGHLAKSNPMAVNAYMARNV